MNAQKRFQKIYTAEDDADAPADDSEAGEEKYTEKSCKAKYHFYQKLSGAGVKSAIYSNSM